MKKRSTRKPTRSKTELSVSESELGAIAKQAEAAHSNTSREALEAQFGKGRIVDKPDGSWELKLNTIQESEAFAEMDRPRQRLESENAAMRNSLTPHVTLRNRDGRTATVPHYVADSIVDDAEKSGVQVHEKPYYGKPTQRYRATKSGLERVF